MEQETKAKERFGNVEVLVMYDVRGIQNYIFRTNHIKDIIGASAMVENIITEGLEQIVAEKAWDKTLFLTKWESDQGDEFLKNEKIQMQVMFIGGGNAYVLFRTGELAHEVNKKLAKYVLDHTYSLNLAVAMVEKSVDYADNYKKINEEMRYVKGRMPEVKPVGAMPFMAVDSITGYPLSKIEKIKNEEGEIEQKKWLCTETFLKREKFPKGESAEKILDNMVTEKGDNSSLAIVHIDGNNMGKRIQKIMSGKTDYVEAITTMRRISKNIKNGFQEAYEAMENYIDVKLAPKVKENSAGKLHRKIILAGDDITFICNASVAIDAVVEFLHQVSEKKLYEDVSRSKEENLKEYAFSACAGIAFINSHFPFSDGYKVAEECCASAKKKAKSTEHRAGGEVEGNIGNFLDYQICTHIKAADLELYREENYVVEGLTDPIINRPYYVPCEVLDSYADLNRRNNAFDISKMLNAIGKFQNIPRGQAKTLRNSYALGNAEVGKYITFLKSRKVSLPEDVRTCWYDALELMDLYPKTKAEKEAKDEA